MVGQKIKRENLARYYGGIINSGEWYLADKADLVMDAYEARIKELEAENFKLKIKLGNKVVPSILNAKNEECLMERIEETK